MGEPGVRGLERSLPNRHVRLSLDADALFQRYFLFVSCPEFDAGYNVTGTTAPPRLRLPAERYSREVRQHAGAHSMHQSRHDADSYQRVEVITGRRRRRDWSDDEKARILAESAEPEVNISEVARRNGVSRGLLNVWRRKARLASSEGPLFVQLRLDDAVQARADAIEQPRVVARPAERIEVTIAGATVRVPVGVDAATLERVLAAVRSTR